MPDDTAYSLARSRGNRAGVFKIRCRRSGISRNAAHISVSGIGGRDRCGVRYLQFIIGACRNGSACGNGLDRIRIRTRRAATLIILFIFKEFAIRRKNEGAGNRFGGVARDTAGILSAGNRAGVFRRNFFGACADHFARVPRDAARVIAAVNRAGVRNRAARSDRRGGFTHDTARIVSLFIGRADRSRVRAAVDRALTEARDTANANTCGIACRNDAGGRVRAVCNGTHRNAYDTAHVRRALRSAVCGVAAALTRGGNRATRVGYARDRDVSARIKSNDTADRIGALYGAARFGDVLDRIRGNGAVDPTDCAADAITRTGDVRIDGTGS